MDMNKKELLSSKYLPNSFPLGFVVSLLLSLIIGGFILYLILPTLIIPILSFLLIIPTAYFLGIIVSVSLGAILIYIFITGLS